MKVISWSSCIVVSILISFSVAQFEGKSLDDLIKDVFVTPLNPETTTTTVRPITTAEDTLNPCTEGECVSYFLCANGSIITDGDGVLDIRIGGDENEGGDKTKHPCPGLFETCCMLRSDLPMIPIPTRPPHVDGSTRHHCGYRNTDGVGFRITGNKDNESQFGEFPWTVAVLKEDQVRGETISVYQCGASLIHPSVVLTAAHCVSTKSPSELKIRAGEWDTQTTDELLPHQDRQVADIIIHPDYYAGALFNDVALLFLDTPVDLAENVNTVCLPAADANFDGSRCFASGWGKDQFGRDGKYSVILKRVELPVVPHDQCQALLQQTRLGKRFQLHRSFVCAGGENGMDTCKGDGGSPLVCPVEGASSQYQQTGIVAWGIGCGDKTPGVYVNVGLFRSWIDNQLQLKQLNSSYYSR